jgi:hypothetical protein
VDRVALGQICSGQSGAGTDLLWTEWRWDRRIEDRVAVGQIYGGWIGTGTYLF